MRLVTELRSHLQYKIILPFLLLTLLVALVGSALAFFFVAASAQERLNNQLAQVARLTSDSIVGVERANLEFLREVAFAGPNVQSGTPAVADALAAEDHDGLEQALMPYFQVSRQRGGVRLDRLIVFDTDGRSLIDWERRTPQDSAAESPLPHPTRDLHGLWFVPRILQGQSDPVGDKFAGLLDLSDSDTRYLFSVAPVIRDQRPVGGILIASRLDSLLLDLQRSSLAAITTIYSGEDGRALTSTVVPVNGLDGLQIRKELLSPIRDLQIDQSQGIFDVVSVNERGYQFAYAPLRIRGAVAGLISVALAQDYVTNTWVAVRAPLVGLTIVLMLGIIALGVFIAQQITRPLRELVETSQAVIGGDLQRRSQVTALDEVGILSSSFNEMTEHLIALYAEVRAEASQRAAIVESITDGVVVCNPDGELIVINLAMRALLRLGEGQPAPRRYDQIPLRPLDEPVTIFGRIGAANLFNLHDQIVRVATAPVLGDAGERLGDVYVFQDLTSEVAIDRAKTNFIATISHELRTPLTVLNGSSELIIRGMVGPLTPEQQALIETMRRHSLSMTAVLNNVITIAGLESGTLTFDLEPVNLGRLLEELLWPFRSTLASKGLELHIDLAPDLPKPLADEHQLRNVLSQLLDNARRYTDHGSISVRAYQQGDLVRVDVSDTGPGISPALCGQLFTRFSRGEMGINSTERGIGLGLAIVRMLLERQGGRIWLEQTSDAGSTFSFTLMCAHGQQSDKNTILANVA